MAHVEWLTRRTSKQIVWVRFPMGFFLRGEGYGYGYDHGFVIQVAVDGKITHTQVSGNKTCAIA